MSRRAELVPQRMTDRALYERALNLVAFARWRHGLTPAEREKVLDELRDVLEELRLRGTQLRLV